MKPEDVWRLAIKPLKHSSYHCPLLANRIACDSCGYPASEARYLTTDEFRKAKFESKERIEPKVKTPDLRKEFEEWHQPIGPHARANADAPYQYTNTYTQAMYEGFCAGYHSRDKEVKDWLDKVPTEIKGTNW